MKRVSIPQQGCGIKTFSCRRGGQGGTFSKDEYGDELPPGGGKGILPSQMEDNAGWGAAA